MRKLVLFLTLALLSSVVLSAPFITSDPTTQTVTHCGLLMDATAKVDVPVVTTVDGKICKFDLSAITPGTHTVKATFINLDPVWGRIESALSIPLSLTRPSTTLVAPPGGLVISP